MAPIRSRREACSLPRGRVVHGLVGGVAKSGDEEPDASSTGTSGSVGGPGWKSTRVYPAPSRPPNKLETRPDPQDGEMAQNRAIAMSDSPPEKNGFCSSEPGRFMPMYRAWPSQRIERRRIRLFVSRRILADTVSGSVVQRGATAEICQVVHAQCAATSRSRPRLAAKNRPRSRPCFSFSSRAFQLSALLPIRLRMPVSSAEITALPSRKRRPVYSTRSR